MNTIMKLVIRTATMNDIPSIVNVRLASTVKGETQGFEAPEWVTYSSSEEMRRACMHYGDIYGGKCYSSISMSGVAYVRRNNVSIRAFYYFARMHVYTLTLGQTIETSSLSTKSLSASKAKKLNINQACTIYVRIRVPW